MKRVKLIAAGVAVPFTIEVPTEGEPLGLSGTFVPMTVAEVAAYRRSVVDAKSQTVAEVRASGIAKQMVSWDADGNPDCRDPKNIAALPPFFFDALENRITGYAFSAEQGGDDHKSAAGGSPAAA